MMGNSLTRDVDVQVSAVAIKVPSLAFRTKVATLLGSAGLY
jgi:hypothetical protein